jgi:hypothetical protein
MTESITAPGGERALGPSYAGRVVLDLGADIGALVLDTPAELAGREIEISPASSGPVARRTHALVRERRASAGTSYAAIYPDLPADDYIIWRDADVPAGTVTIHGGGVAHYRWPDSQPLG